MRLYRQEPEKFIGRSGNQCYNFGIMADKLVFLVAETDRELSSQVVEQIHAIFEGCTVYTASEGNEALKKMRNVPPKALITGLELGSKVTFHDLLRNMELDRALAGTPVLVLSDMEDSEPQFQGDLARGRIKFLSKPWKNEELAISLRSLVQAENLKNNIFQTISLKSGEILFLEGGKADSAFLVKSGKLQATRQLDGTTLLLGEVLPGEFVGEMAHITGEPRSADVRAVENTELVEIPCGTLDLLIFSKPTWTRSLLKTLCRRLKEANLRKGGLV